MTSPKGRVLLIEDEAGLIRTLSDRLVAEGWAVETADDGHRGLAAVLAGRADVVVLDVMLPGIDGFEVLRQIRDHGIATPVIMLTALDQVEDKVAAFRIGADDYLAKPFRPIELLARLEAILRRVRGRPLSASERTIHFGDWVVDLENEELRRGEAVVALSRTEFDLLAYLAARRGRAVPRAELLREVWRYAPDAATRTVDQHVAQLRNKLGGSRHLVTVHGHGYQFRA